MIVELIVAGFVIAFREASRPSDSSWPRPEVAPARVHGMWTRLGPLGVEDPAAPIALERCAACSKPTLAALHEPRANAVSMPRDVCTC